MAGGEEGCGAGEGSSTTPDDDGDPTERRATHPEGGLAKLWSWSWWEETLPASELCGEPTKLPLRLTAGRPEGVLMEVLLPLAAVGTGGLRVSDWRREAAAARMSLGDWCTSLSPRHGVGDAGGESSDSLSGCCAIAHGAASSPPRSPMVLLVMMGLCDGSDQRSNFPASKRQYHHHDGIISH